MPTSAEFEEKEYEVPLNRELVGASPHLWSPGQVFEKHFGIDAALDVFSPSFWRQVGLSVALSGAVLDHFNFGYIWRKTGVVRQLPTFSCNLFLQAKRPEVAIRLHPGVSNLKSPHWRFPVKSHQQQAMERLAHKLGHRGLVAYGCAAFDTLERLFQFIETETLVENSTFVKAEKLRGHESWAYDRPGTVGIACSVPEPSDDVPFLDQIHKLSGSDAGGEFRGDPTAEKMLAELAKIVREVCVMEQSISNNPRAAQFLRISKDWKPKVEIDRLQQFVDIVRSYMDVQLFCWLFGIHWHVVGPPAEI